MAKEKQFNPDKFAEHKGIISLPSDEQIFEKAEEWVKDKNVSIKCAFIAGMKWYELWMAGDDKIIDEIKRPPGSIVKKYGIGDIVEFKDRLGVVKRGYITDDYKIRCPHPLYENHPIYDNTEIIERKIFCNDISHTPNKRH